MKDVIFTMVVLPGCRQFILVTRDFLRDCRWRYDIQSRTRAKSERYAWCATVRAVILAPNATLTVMAIDMRGDVTIIYVLDHFGDAGIGTRLANQDDDQLMRVQGSRKSANVSSVVSWALSMDNMRPDLAICFCSPAFQHLRLLEGSEAMGLAWLHGVEATISGE